MFGTPKSPVRGSRLPLWVLLTAGVMVLGVETAHGIVVEMMPDVRTNLQQNDTFTVDLVISGVTSPAVETFNLVMSFDPTFFHALGVQDGDFIQQQLPEQPIVYQSIDNVLGQLSYTTARLGPMGSTGSGTAATVTFQYLQPTGMAGIWWRVDGTDTQGEILVTEIGVGNFGQSPTPVPPTPTYTPTPPTDPWDHGDDTWGGATVLTPEEYWQTHGPHTLNEVYGDAADWYQIAMTSGVTYQFHSGYGTGDPKAELFSSAMELVAWDDNSRGLWQFRLSFEAPSTATYYLKVSPSTPGPCVAYLSYVRFAPGTAPDPTPTPTAIATPTSSPPAPPGGCARAGGRRISSGSAAAVLLPFAVAIPVGVGKLRRKLRRQDQ